MKLSKLLNNLNAMQVTGSAEEIEIDNISIDSREVNDNSVFIAISGFKQDGHKYIQEVISKGVRAIVVEDEVLPEHFQMSQPIVIIKVENSRVALAKLSNDLYDSASKKLKLIGITGTKGKTTTSYFVKNIFNEAKLKSGLIGTNKNIIDTIELKTALTTPQANVVNKLMSEMLKQGCTHCVMEVSSHALHLNRVDEIEFDVSMFTNITSDHMDYHKDFDGYLSAKKILFDKAGEDKKVVYNIDDPNWGSVVKDSLAELISYGKNDIADFIISNITYDLNGTKFTISNNGNEWELETCLCGEFNAYNAAAAFTAAHELGIDVEAIVEGIKTTPQVPGRFEVIGDSDKKIVIDYSHTTDSLKQALNTLQVITKGSIPVYTVFGCGGDRDSTKRSEMGRVAEELSDKIFITSDNPRTENPIEIIEDIKKGLTQNKHVIIENREEAIKTAIKQSPANSVILIAGKGHEDYQEINGVRTHFSDKEEAIKYLSN